MPERVVFPHVNQVELETFELAPVTAATVRVRTSFSLMSTGTEGIVLHAAFDEGTHWAEWATYPFHPGYAAVGVVDEVSPDVSDVQVGDVVAARLPHASEHVIEAKRCTLVPPAISAEDATWFGLAKIALMGARAAAYELGDTVAIIGAGPIGQMSIRWAHAAGTAAVVAIDPASARLELARTGGASAVVAAPIDEATDAIIAACGGRRPRVVVDTTGNAAVFSAALGVAEDRGRVVLLGDTGSPAGQHLTPDVVIRGLSITGAHDGHSVKQLGWDGDRSIHRLFFNLVSTDRFSLKGLNTHTFNPKDCKAAYDTSTRQRGETMGILFDWTQR